MRTLVHFDLLDQFRLDEDGTLAVFLEALGHAIEDDFHVLHFIEAPDIEALAAGTGRAGQVHAGQGVEQGRDIVGLLAFDVGAVDIRASGRAGADGVAEHADGRHLHGVGLLGLVGHRRRPRVAVRAAQCQRQRGRQRGQSLFAAALHRYPCLGLLAARCLWNEKMQGQRTAVHDQAAALKEALRRTLPARTRRRRMAGGALQSPDKLP
ncbi:hypothetical protein D3C72_1622580 [compost metagenome]